jgi:hypothetical protein
MNVRAIYSAAVLAAMLGLSLAESAVVQAQDQETTVLMPEQSAAKAKEIMRRAAEALGGAAYLNVHDVTCTAKLSQFGHSGELNGYAKIEDQSIVPDKDRTENIPKRNLITVINGDKGWELDRGGVSEAPLTTVSQYQDDTKKDIDNILRNRINEKDMIFRYTGTDIVDLRAVDWVELVDSDNRTIRIAFSQSTHLPVRKVVTTRDPNTRLRSEEVEYYSNYQPMSGVLTPLQITREKNNIKIYQVFFDKCEYNTGLSPELFTKESLDERWAKIGKKQKPVKSSSNNKSGWSKN